MDESLECYDHHPYPPERDSSQASLLHFLDRNEQLICSLTTADQFEGCEIIDLIKRMSKDGLIQLTPDFKDIASISLCLTERGKELATELAIAEHMITCPVQDYSRFSLMHPSPLTFFGHALDDL